MEVPEQQFPKSVPLDIDSMEPKKDESVLGLCKLKKN